VILLRICENVNLNLFPYLKYFYYIKFLKTNNKSVKKANLPTKNCVTCGRPFTWRKKWEKVWEEVKYCSDKCRSAAKS
jgi:hypothetical protein